MESLSLTQSGGKMWKVTGTNIDNAAPLPDSKKSSKYVIFGMVGKTLAVILFLLRIVFLNHMVPRFFLTTINLSFLRFFFYF